MQKISSIVMAIAMMASVILIPTAAADAASYNGYEYKVVGSNVEIVKYNGSGTSLTVPSAISGKNVTSIGDYAFADNYSITSVKLPNTVTTIGKYAFADCLSLKKVTLPSSLNEIKEGAFYDCMSLTGISFPDSLQKIGARAFEYCISIQSIKITNNITSIGASPFLFCISLSEFIVESSARGYSCKKNVLFNKAKTRLVTYAPNRYDTSYTVPASVTNIDEGAFSGAPLEKVMVNSGNQNYVNANGVLYTKDKKTLLAYSPLKSNTSSFTVPSTVTKIGAGAFSFAAYLEKVTIPKTVTSFGDGVFFPHDMWGTLTVQCAASSKAYSYVKEYEMEYKLYMPYCTATLSTTSYVYDGTAKKPAVTVKDGSTTLKKDTDYTISYSNNTKEGEAKVTIKGKGKYTGTTTKTYRIVPAKATLSTVSSSAKKQLSLTWKKDAGGASGYEVQTATNSSFTQSKNSYLASSSSTSKTIGGKTSGKTYYVRVRAYKTINNTKYYGSWSSAKPIKIK